MAPRHSAMYLLDTRWKQMHNAMRVREGTVTITGNHPHSRWSLCVQGHSILSQYQASYPAILDIATSLSLNKLLGRYLSSWTKIFMHIRILILIDTHIRKPLLAATPSNKPR